MRAYAYLFAAIASEVFGTTALKLSAGFSKPLPSLAVVVGYGGSFYLLSLVLEQLPVGVVYATWAAAGIVATALVGAVVFEEPLDAASLVGIALIVSGVVVLNVVSDAATAAH
jgi:small multidrug resistance pump